MSHASATAAATRATSWRRSLPHSARYRLEGLEPAIEEELIRILLRLQTGQRLDIPLIQSVVNTLYEYLAEVRTPYSPVVAAHT